MTVRFSLGKAHKGEQVIGFIQDQYKPSNFIEANFNREACPKCQSTLFPQNDDSQTPNLACPICNPSLEFKTDTYRFPHSLERRKLYLLIFDSTIPAQAIQAYTEALASYMTDTDKAIILFVSTSIFIAQTREKISEFVAFQNPPSKLKPSFFLTKDDIQNTLLKSLKALLTALPPITEFDITKLLTFITGITLDKYCSIVFLQQPVSSITADMAAYYGFKIYEHGSIINFTTNGSQKKLTAIAQFSGGCVYIVGYVDPIHIKIIIERSHMLTIKLEHPSSLVSSSIASLTFEKKGTKTVVYRGLGCAGTFYSHDKVDLNVTEVTNTVDGTYITVHRLRGEMPFDHRILVKTGAFSILKTMWTGEDWQGEAHKNAAYLKDSIAYIMPKDADRTALRLYFAMKTTDKSLKCQRLEERGFKAIVEPPYVQFDKIPDKELIDKIVREHDWPLTFLFPQQ